MVITEVNRYMGDTELSVENEDAGRTGRMSMSDAFCHDDRLECLARCAAHEFLIGICIRCSGQEITESIVFPKTVLRMRLRHILLK